MSNALIQCMKKLMILIASILVTSTFAFAEDINDKPITCTKEQAKEVLAPLIGYYDDIVPEDKGLALAQEAVNEYNKAFGTTGKSRR